MFSAQEGTPDGMTFDADGHVWMGFWGGACVRQLRASDASTLQYVPVPATQVTSVAFGGPVLRTQCITSARVGLDGAALLARALFILREAAQGMVACCWA